MTTLAIDELEARVLQDHANAVGKVHLCNFVSGYLEDTDDSIDVFLDPPLLVKVDPDDNGVLHNNDTHLDPYWDVTPVDPKDPRISKLRSMWTYGPSYEIPSGKPDPQVCIWLKPPKWWERLFNFN